MARSSAPNVRISSAFCSVLSLLLTMIIQGRGQPILPSLSYPVFMMVPPHPQEQDTAATNIPEEGFEVSQFHSQDELGRVVFGFHSPDQSRLEARSLDGSVRGSYSYIDPYGHIVKMQYWDDGTGFHVAGNALPLDGNPPYTPEVAAAREQHFKIYRQTLAATQQLMQHSDESTFADSPDSDPSLAISQFEDIPQYNTDHQNNGLFEDDKESISLENPEIYGNQNIFQEDERIEEKQPEKEQVEGEVDLGEDIIPDEIDEDGYENGPSEISQHKFTEGGRNERINEYDDDYGEIILRLKHSTNYNGKEEDEQDEEKDEKKDTDNENEDEEDLGEDEDIGKSEEDENHSEESQESNHADDEIIERKDQIREDTAERGKIENVLESEDHYEPDKSENRKSEVRTLEHPLIQSGVGSIKPSTYFENTDGQIKDKSTQEMKVITPSVKRRGFFYHFQHTIPKPTERIDETIEKGLKSASSIKLAPMLHDPQLFPYQFADPQFFPFPQV